MCASESLASWVLFLFSCFLKWFYGYKEIKVQDESPAACYCWTAAWTLDVLLVIKLNTVRTVVACWSYFVNRVLKTSTDSGFHTKNLLDSQVSGELKHPKNKA